MKKVLSYVITITIIILVNLIAGITGVCPFLHRILGL